MIELYSGTPGSGKSYHACRTIHDALKWKKKKVIANFEVVTQDDWEGDFVYLANRDTTPDVLRSIASDTWAEQSFAEDGIYWVVDEAQCIWNSRLWNDQQRIAWIEFFSQHRKYGYHVIFIAQSSGMIDKQFRALIEYEVKHRSIGNFGIFGKALNFLTFSKWFVCPRYYFGMNERLDCEYIRFSKRIADMYNSYRTFDGSMADAAQAAAAKPVVVSSVVQTVKPIEGGL